jgi:signal transduction histidine kinase
VRVQPLRRRLLALAAAGIVPIAVTAGIGLYALIDEDREQAARTGLELTRALASAADAELSRSIAVLEGVSTSPALDSGDLERYRNTMLRTLETRPDWVTITLADPSGQQLANPRRPQGEKLPVVVDLPSLQAAVRSRAPVIGALSAGPRGDYAIPVRVPVIRNGEVRYVLTAAMKPDAFVAVLERQRLPEGWVVSVFDSSNMRVARSRKHAEYFNTPPSPTLIELIGGSRGHEGAGVTRALEGDEIYTAFTRSSLSGWTTAIGLPASAVEAAAWRSLAAYGGGLLLSLVIAALSALFVARRIAQPIGELSDAAAALGRRAPVRTPDSEIREIREVGAALESAAVERARYETERESLLMREQEARAAAERASRAKDEFLAMLGHELRNPLGALSNASWLLREPNADAQTRQRASEVIARQTEHLKRLTDDLLDAARAMLGKIVLHRRPFNLAAAVAGVLGTLQSAGRLSAHHVQRDLQPVWVDGDYTRVEQIVTNLVGNAIKYTPARGTITVRVRKHGDEALLTVADNGAGMPADLLSRVFDPFVQGERELDRAHGGLGIGLTLVRRLAELHGGAASAASAGPGLGSEFQVRFPAVEPPSSVAEKQAPNEAGMSRDVLIVEDNADAAATLRSLLELSGHRVRVARDGQEGLDALQERMPDLALIDLGLPRLDGYEVARRARAMLNGRRSTLLVAVTGYGLPEDRRRSAAAGFDEHLVKPVDLAALRTLLARLSH